MNKGTTNQVRRLMLTLEKARKEFDSIAKGFRRDDDFALASEETCPGWESNPHEEKSPEDFKSSASAIPPPGQRQTQKVACMDPALNA